MPHTDILWIDDQSTMVERCIRVFNMAGLNIEGTDNPYEGLKKLKTKGSSIHLILLDLDMDEMDGIEAYKRIRQINRHIPVCFISAFRHDVRYEKQLDDLGEDLNFIPKPLPSDLSPDFNEIVEKLKRLKSLNIKYENLDEEKIFIRDNTINDEYIKSGMKAAEKPQGIEEQVNMSNELNPFKIPLKDFQKLPLSKTLSVIKNARVMNQEIVAKFFEENPHKNWLIISKLAGNIVKSGKEENIVTNEFLENVAKEQQAPIYSYFRMLDVIEEDTSTIPPIDYYPQVQLKFISLHKESIFEFDFDTGSTNTYLNFEVLDNHNHLPPINPHHIRTSNWQNEPFTYIVHNFKVEHCKVVGYSGNFVGVNLDVKLIFDWDLSSFTRHYKQRLGLVGRNLLVKNQIKLLLDSIKRDTDVIP